MTLKDPITTYVCETTEYFYNKAFDIVDNRFGKGYGLKHPSNVVTILRFQEEIMRAVCTAIASGNLKVSDILEEK